ncbi:MAG: GTP 3',8-cyclase MoaA [Bacteroidota bacterium]|nr:GTP 3',8-cyclase MoaA [Bacteroidota bacterium]
MSFQLKDSFGRIINNMRISVTDRCNFRCRYCMPEEGMVWMNRNELLTFEEITRVVRIVSQLGISKIRLTGGEPLMRKELHRLVKQIAGVEDIHDIAMTTNGFFLKEQARELAEAGLRRITVSLDSLDPIKFSEMTRRDYFHKVWESLELLTSLFPAPIKLNVVLIRGINDDEIEKFAELARTKPFIVRFIEYMPIGADDAWENTKVVPTHEIIERINAKFPPLAQVEYHGHQPADRFRFSDGIGEIGFISSVSEPFCSSCNRIRITSDGKLRTCLFSLHETDLKTPLRTGASDDILSEMIIDAVRKKEEGHLINRPGFVKPQRTMSQIGG